MHDESQIPNKVRTDASNSRDNGEKPGYRCLCGKTLKTLKGIQSHRSKCEVYQTDGNPIGKVRCEICKEHWARRLHTHLRIKHGIDKEDYPYAVMSEDCKSKYSAANVINGDWVSGCTDEEKIRNWKKAISASTTESIMSDPEERLRRSKLLGELNKREDFRRRASETAIKTSARREILEQRSENLRRWRENNPEAFATNWQKMLSSGYKINKPEGIFKNWLKVTFPLLEFKYSGFIKSSKLEKYNKSKRKQIDFVSSDKKFYIELDGPFHFPFFNGRTPLSKLRESWVVGSMETTMAKDRIVEEILKERSKCLIRVSYDCWDSDGNMSEKVLDKIKEIVHNNNAGIFKIGEGYGEDNCL